MNTVKKRLFALNVIKVTKITNSQNTENIWSAEWAAVSQKVATQQPKPN